MLSYRTASSVLRALAGLKTTSIVVDLTPVNQPMLYKAHPQFSFPFLLLCLKHGCQSRRPQDEYTDVSVATSRAEIEVSEHLMPLLYLPCRLVLVAKMSLP